MDNTDAGPPVYCHANHARDVIQVALREALGPIKRVNPDDHLLLEELVRELIVVVVCLRGRHSINLLHFLQIAPVAMPLHVVVGEEHLLTDVVVAQLVWHDVWLFCRHSVFHGILLADDRGSRVELLQIVLHRVLNVHIDLGEDVGRAGSFLHRNVGEAGDFANAMNNRVSTLEQLDAG